MTAKKVGTTARLNLPAAELLKRLRPLAAGRKGERLVIMATPANSGPIMAALARRMNEGDAA